MIPLSDLRLMLVKVSPVGVSGDKIMAELQKAERLDMLEGCGEMPLRPPSVRGFLFCGSRMSVPGQSRRFDLASITSGLPRNNGHHLTGPA